MGKKAEAGTPKAIANASKAKGLQRLRYYCQVCEKQCRDENAFKQHSLSEGHVRQMLVVGEHAGTYIEQYSREFQNDFLALLSRRWGTKRVRANQVYQEFIQDKHHSHMNATRWVTLTGFLQHLGRSGICHVDETEKGWFMAWIDNSPKALARQDAALKRERQDMGDEERQRRFLNEQIEKARVLEAEKQSANGEEASTSQLPAAEEEETFDVSAIQPIKMSIGGGKASDKGKGKESPPLPTDNTEAKPAENGDGVVEKEAQPVDLTSVPAPTIVKPRTNPLKMGSSKPNPLKSNPLKSKAAKPSEASPSSASAGTKRPLSAVEAIVQEEMERKRWKEQGTWSSARGHGSDGLQRRH